MLLLWLGAFTAEEASRLTSNGNHQAQKSYFASPLIVLVLTSLYCSKRCGIGTSSGVSN